MDARDFVRDLQAGNWPSRLRTSSAIERMRLGDELAAALDRPECPPVGAPLLDALPQSDQTHDSGELPKPVHLGNGVFMDREDYDRAKKAGFVGIARPTMRGASAHVVLDDDAFMSDATMDELRIRPRD